MNYTAMRDAFGAYLVELGKTHPELMVLDADVSSSTKTGMFGQAFPERFFNVGVAEANMVDTAAGLATAGYHPVVSTFSIFLALKTADQIRNVVCYNNLPVIIAGGYGGLSDSFDGASHQSITDVAIMRSFPNMTVLLPSDASEVRDALDEAMKLQGPVFIRLSRNPTPDLFEDEASMNVGGSRMLAEGEHITIAAAGVPLSMAIEARKQLFDEGIHADLIELFSVKPIDRDTLMQSVRKTRRLLTVEEHSVIGGLGSACLETVCREVPFIADMVGIEDTFTESGPYDAIMEKFGISTGEIVRRARELAGRNV